MLIIWLQGIWLPLHGYNFSDTPLWAGIFLLPLTAGFITAGPVSGYLSDRYGARPFATAGMVLFALSFVGLLLLPVNFSYWEFAVLVLLNGIGSGMFAAPNTSAIMSSVPPKQRGQASGMRATFMNSGQAISIGVFFSLLISGLHATLPSPVLRACRPKASRPTSPPRGIPAARVDRVRGLSGLQPDPDPSQPYGCAAPAAGASRCHLDRQGVLPPPVERPFHHGLVVVFTAAALMAAVAAVVSAMRGTQYHHEAGPAAPTSSSRSSRQQTSPESPEDTAAAEAQPCGPDDSEADLARIDPK